MAIALQCDESSQRQSQGKKEARTRREMRAKRLGKPHDRQGSDRNANHQKVKHGTFTDM
jgi:hypothetical protein